MTTGFSVNCSSTSLPSARAYFAPSSLSAAPPRHQLASSARAVRSVVHGDLAPFVQPGDHVGQRRHRQVQPCLGPHGVLGVEELVLLMAAETGAPIVPDVEDASSVAEPGE